MALEKLKKALKERIEKNSVKTELTYKDNGEEVKEEVYLKRGTGLLGDWHRVYLPIKDDGTNKWDVNNALFGGKKNLWKLGFWIIFAILLLLTLKEAYSNYEALRNLPCVQACLEKIRYG